MRFGVLLLPTDPWLETVLRAQHLEALGYDHLWTYDHLSWRRYRGRPWHSAIPWLTGLAGVTERIRLGTMVASPNLRHPVTLAQDTVTLDHVSGGRFVLGVGAGGIGFDATVFGEETLTKRELVARLEEFVALLARLFAEEIVSHAGTYYALNEACIRPTAVQVPRVPIAIAAAGEKALGVVARHGDAWITIIDAGDHELTPAAAADRVRTQMRRLDDACIAVGREPASVQRIYLVGNTQDRPLAGTAAFEDFVGRYSDIGFTDLVFHYPRADDPVWAEPATMVDEIATEVLPRWR